MRELSLVLGLLFMAGTIAAGVAGMTRYGGLEEGWLTMIALGSGAVACELVYFGLLFLSLRRGGEVPERWYARSFEHHHLLTSGQKWAVLPFFYVGGLGLLLALLLSGVLFFAGLQTLAG